MKYKHETRKTSALLSLIAIIGILFSIIGIGLTWYITPKVQGSVTLLIDILDQTLTNTNDALIVVKNALESTNENLNVIGNTLETLPDTIENISNSLQSSADLIGGELKDTIIDTQTALSSAASSAGLIDNTLKFIAAIPLLGADYRPEVPLSVSLKSVAESLDGIPESFVEIQTFINDSGESLVQLKSDATDLSNSVREFDSVIKDAQKVVMEYNQIVENLQEQLTNLRSFSSNFLLIVGILASFGFFLLGISQFSIFKLQNIEKSTLKETEQQFDNQDDKTNH